MRYIGLLVLFVAAVGCKSKPDSTSAGSGGDPVSKTASGTATGSGSAAAAPAGSNAGSSAESTAGSAASSFDAELTMPNQPERSAAEATKIRAAEQELRSLLTAAKTATNGKELCGRFEVLQASLEELHTVTAPAGAEEEYGSARDSLLQLFDGVGDCEDADVETLQLVLGMVRDEFVKVVTIGA